MYKILGYLGPLGKNLKFLSHGIDEGFSELSVYTEVVLLKTFPQHFELCIYCNIEVMKFCNIGDKRLKQTLVKGNILMF